MGTTRKRFLYGAAAALLMAAAAAVGMRRASMPGVPGAPAGAPALVSIAAAADLRYALAELTAQFEAAQPAIDLSVSYGSSGSFFAQLLNGAPFDVFLSADVSYPRQLAERGLTVAGTEFTYAEGRLVVWVPSSSALDVEKIGLGALTDPRVSRVAIANPAHAPYGRAAEAAMRSAGILDEVRPRIVLGENVSQAMQFVQSGAAEIGIVALSLAVAPAVAESGKYWLVPPEAHPRIEQGGTIMRSARDVGAARAFRAFMLSEAARAVLKQYGFSLPVV